MSLKLFLGSFLQLSSFQHPPTSKFVWNKNSVYIGNKMVNSLTSHKSAHYFFPGKNRNRKIRKKSGYEIPGIFVQILLFDHT